MMQPTAEIVGLKELRRSLRRAGDSLADLKEANARAARIAGMAAKSRAPRLSGALQASVRSTGTKTAGIIRAGYKSVPYARPIHWGWPGRHITAQPFLSQGAQASEPQWLPLYLATLQRIVNNITT